MHRETPNETEIDQIADWIRRTYDYDRLKDCDLDYLHNLEYALEARLVPFERSFPPSQSAVQGEYRAFLLDDEKETKEALTDPERMRLDLLREEAKTEIHRAKGHRIETKREQRNKLAGSVSDAISSVFDSISRLLEALTP